MPWTRDNRWERVAEAYDALTLPSAEIADPEQWVEESYRQEITDEFVKPAACCEGGRISDGDSVMFFNFRPDRARELTRALTQPGFDGFEKKAAPKDLCYVCTTVYDDSFEGVLVAFPPSARPRPWAKWFPRRGFPSCALPKPRNTPM